MISSLSDPGVQRFLGKVAIVTGSTRGLGLAISQRLALEGASVILTGRSEQGGREACASIIAAGGNACFVAGDLTRQGEAARLIAEAVATYGRIDVLINNTAATDVITGRDSTVEHIASDAWEAIISGAATVAMSVTQAAIPHLRNAGGGAIVNISTSVATRGIHGMVGHSASKAAVEAISRSTAVEVGGDGIRSNALVLGFIVSSPRQEAVSHSPRGEAILSTQLLPRFGAAEDVAAAVSFLASDEARFVTGASLHVDGGAACRMPLSILPGAGRSVDHYGRAAHKAMAG